MYSYCGPYWSDRKIQASVAGTSPAQNPLDQLCKEHDAHYARGDDLQSADWEFVTGAARQGAVGALMAGAVLPQYVGRAVMSAIMNKRKRTQPNATPPSVSRKTPTMQVSRQIAVPQQRRQPPIPRLSTSKANTPGTTTVLAPAAIGTSINRFNNRIVSRGVDKMLIGRDFVCEVPAFGSARFSQSCTIPTNPSYFVNGEVGNLCRAFEKFRYHRLSYRFIPRVPTTTTGEILLCSTKEVINPGLDTAAASFLGRAMAQGNSTLGALWLQHEIPIDCDGQWRMTNPLLNTDIDDNIMEEIQVYTQTASSLTVGYIIADYTISFKEPIFQPHATTIPIPNGHSTQLPLVDAAAINAVNDAVVLTNATLTALANGSVFKLSLNLTGTTLPTGATALTAVSNSLSRRTTSVTTTTLSMALPLVDGTVLYGLVLGTNLYIYASIEAAVAGTGSGQLFYGAITSAVGSWLFNTYLVRIGLNTMTQSQ
jgi:hypothetical protein